MWVDPEYFQRDDDRDPRVSPEPIDGRCNANVPENDPRFKSEGYCALYPSLKEDGYGDRCYMHLGNAKNEHNVGNQHAMTHSLYTKRSTYYQNLDAEDQAWIDGIIDSYLEVADFDRSHLGNTEILRNVAIDMHKIRTANDYVQDKGIAQIQQEISGSGNVVEKDVENVLNLPIDRMEKSILRRLKELGLLDDPDSKKADATETLAEVLSSVELDEDE